MSPRAFHVAAGAMTAFTVLPGRCRRALPPWRHGAMSGHIARQYAGRGPLGIYGHCCKSSCPGRGLTTAPGRLISIMASAGLLEVLRHTDAVVRKDEGAASAFRGTQCARTNRLVESRATGTRD